MFYTFITSTNIKYNISKFNGLLIDLGIATRLTRGIGQLKILQRVVFIELGKPTAGLTNFFFRIDSNSFY